MTPVLQGLVTPVLQGLMTQRLWCGRGMIGSFHLGHNSIIHVNDPIAITEHAIVMSHHNHRPLRL